MSDGGSAGADAASTNTAEQVRLAALAVEAMKDAVRLSKEQNATAASGGLSVPVLIVDDNPVKRLALTAVLAPLGYTVVEADSGMAALRCLLAQDFAVILLDVLMPTMDGFETAALIRRRRQSEMTPIIFITALASDAIVHRDRYVEGAVDFIFAPVRPAELRAKVSVFASLFIKAEMLAVQARAGQIAADQLRVLTDAAPIGIFQTDADTRFIYTNPRWSEITGIPAEAVLGRRWGAMASTGLQKDLIAVADAAEISHRFPIRPPGSHRRIVQLKVKPIIDQVGGIAGWVGTLADVTAEAAAETAMSEARDKATEAARLKSDFLANMSHEIRTPMNGVIGMADLLLETDLDDRQRDYTQTVRNSGEALLVVINDILDFSKVEAGKLVIEDIDFNVGKTVDEVISLLEGPAHKKGLELRADLDPSVLSDVSGDPARVAQVLSNLVGNAIKFSQTGQITIRVADAGLVDGDRALRFEVSDNGEGIAADKLEVIFRPFVQGDSSASRKHEGTGLGLAINGQLVSLMGGESGVSSELGAGSTFWFTIRVHAARALARQV
jgi:PAS domain S-box-containing protein